MRAFTSPTSRLLGCPNEKDLQMEAFSRAAEGIRTLDLLHGKQNVCFLVGVRIPANAGVLACEQRPAIPRLYREFTGV